MEGATSWIGSLTGATAGFSIFWVTFWLSVALIASKGSISAWGAEKFTSEACSEEVSTIGVSSVIKEVETWFSSSLFSKEDCITSWVPSSGVTGFTVSSGITKLCWEVSTSECILKDPSWFTKGCSSKPSSLCSSSSFSSKFCPTGSTEKSLVSKGSSSTLAILPSPETGKESSSSSEFSTWFSSETTGSSCKKSILTSTGAGTGSEVCKRSSAWGICSGSTLLTGACALFSSVCDGKESGKSKLKSNAEVWFWSLFTTGSWVCPTAGVTPVFWLSETGVKTVFWLSEVGIFTK